MEGPRAISIKPGKVCTAGLIYRLWNAALESKKNKK